MEEVLKSENKEEIKRPWQGTFLFYLAIIEEIFLFLIIFPLVFLALFVEKNSFFSLQNSYKEVFFYILLFIMIIPFLIGVLKGWKWVIILSIISSVLRILYSLLNLNSGIHFDCKVIFLILGLFILFYIKIPLLKHPFYNQNKIK